MLCNVIADSKTQRRQVLILLNWKMVSAHVRSTEREESAENQENHHILFHWSNVQAMFLVIY